MERGGGQTKPVSVGIVITTGDRDSHLSLSA